MDQRTNTEMAQSVAPSSLQPAGLSWRLHAGIVPGRWADAGNRDLLLVWEEA